MEIVQPTKQQLEWQDQEIGVIIHYFLAKHYMTNECRANIHTLGKEVRNINRPEDFELPHPDPDQWVRVAKEMGANYAVLVAKHGDGFCLWPSKKTDYTVGSMSWENGCRDLVREFIDACKKYGVKPGIYYCLNHNDYYGVNGPESVDFNSEFYNEYLEFVAAQLTELWTEYGELFEIWFDGGVLPESKIDITGMLKKYQPNAICFQGPRNYPQNLRWVGNERGFAPEVCFSATSYDEDNFTGTVEDEKVGVGSLYGRYYHPAESDMSNRYQWASENGWGWAAGEGHLIYSPEELLERYIHTVGRNSNLLIGMSIAKDGFFEDEQQFISFGKLLKKHFGTPIQISKELTLCTEEPKQISYIVIREDITRGQRINTFEVLADGKLIYSGKSIGHKRIIETENLTASKIELRVTDAVEDWKLRDITIL